MVARGHAWLPGGVCSCQGACVVVGGVVVGGVCGCRGPCMVARGVCIGYDKIQSMSGQYTSYWNAFLLLFMYTDTVSQLYQTN